MGNFRQVTGGYKKASFDPDAGTSAIPGVTVAPLEGLSPELKMFRRNGEHDVYSVDQGANFDEGEPIIATGQSSHAVN